ncbi:MAG: pyruvate kinase [Candidatus Nomurabacteria bacterium]|jgi:pyruvate kinase|nr:pyruvate kinase [Candidatus Nomurabacteria bacterium]
MSEKKFTTKCTKILATVGPVSGNGDRETIEKIMRAGANGLRINFSHAKYEEVEQQIGWIREMARQLDRNVSILADLQGPKIRIGNLKDDMKFEVKAGDELNLTFGIEHDGSNNLPIQYDLSEKVKVGERLYIFDGKINTEIIDVTGKTVKVAVKNDGYFTSRKGINLPDTDFAGDVLTAKDLEDLNFAMGQDFDYVSLSFVHLPGDVKVLREILQQNKSTLRIISKVETRQATEKANLEEIVKVSDGVMVARGDMGYEVGAVIVPVIQHKIIELCQKHCKLSIVATQMMGSMENNPQPTRAETNDVATAAIEGADVVMLSEETAVGKYPSEAVAEMRKTLVYVQENLPVHAIYRREGSDKRRDALAISVVMLAEQLDAAAIIVETRSGKMARNVAIHRPSRRIIAVSGVKSVAQQLPLLYGTRSYHAADIHADYGSKIAERLYEQGAFGEGPVTLVIAKSSAPNFDVSVADTIFIKTIE